MINFYQIVEDLNYLLQELSYKILNIQKNSGFDISYKDIDKTDPVTTADLFSNEYLQKYLKKILPDAYILSEETRDNIIRLNKKLIWVIDPIDGTKDFASQKKTYSISVGLLYNNEPVLGGVAMPGEEYLVIGLNYYKENFQPFLFINYFNSKNKEYIYNFNEWNKTQKNLNQAHILVSEREYQKNNFIHYPEDWKLIPTGSVARKLAMVAIQKGDLLISLSPKKEWDICGGIALIYASRQIAYTLEKENEHFKPLMFNKKKLQSIGLVAGNPFLVKEYLKFHLENKIHVYSTY